MCFGAIFGGGGSRPSTQPVIPPPSDTASTPKANPNPNLSTLDPEPEKKKKRPDWWTPPNNIEPILSLNPEATNQPQSVYDLRNTGRSRLTIPLRGSGLGIPGR